MVHPVLKSLRWSVSIGAKFVRIVPGATAIVVLATLVSQIAMLLAFFLPLKVVILLGSTRTPRYFPPALADIDRDVLVIALSIAAVGSYLLYLLAERVIRYAANYGARRLLERSRKLVLFENQDEVATWGYRLYSRALASGMFVVLAIVVLVLIYPSVALLAAVYGAAVAAVLFALSGMGSQSRERLAMVLKPLLAAVSAVGFLLAFAYVVADFLFWSPPGLLAALISVLLMRQTFTRGTGLIRNVTALYSQRISLNALFFGKHVLLQDHGDVERGIWPLLSPEARLEWLRPALADVLEEEPSELTARWHQTGVGNVAALEVYARDAKRPEYLVRLFDDNRGALAMHEATLLAATSSSSFPAPPFLGATQVERFHCHVFAWPVAGRVPLRRARAAAQEVMERLLAVEPPAALVKRYGRSRPYLWQRLDARLFARLRLAAEEEAQREALHRLEAEWGSIKAILQALPLVIINPDLRANALLMSEDGRPVASYWGRWSLDPVGSAWWVRPSSMERLVQVLALAAETRRSLRVVLPAQVRLAALIFTLEIYYVRQQYVNALDLIPSILTEAEASAFPADVGAGGQA